MQSVLVFKQLTAQQAQKAGVPRRPGPRGFPKNKEAARSSGVTRCAGHAAGHRLEQLIRNQYALGRVDLSPKEAARLYAEKEPMKRWGTIEEFGALCAFLCSRQAGYITGQSIVIDGGKVPALL